MNSLRKVLLLAMLFGSAALLYALPTCEPGYLCYCSSPIVIDLDGKGIHLTDAANGVLFDIAGNGKPVQIAWTAPGVRNAWLVLDRNGNGKIDSGQELFGNFTPQPDCASPNGFNALAEFDKPENGGNGDGIIDSNDAVYFQLRLWIDENHNGISEPIELHTLPELGVFSISLDYNESERRDRYGNKFRYRARINVGYPNNDAGPFAYDVFLANMLPRAQAQSNANVPGTIDGSVAPEQIPTAIVHTLFLRRVSCLTGDSEAGKAFCLAEQSSIGLSTEDQARMAAILTGVLDELLSLDDQVAVAAHQSESDAKTKAASLDVLRREFVDCKIQEIRAALSEEGQGRLNSYLANMRKQVKFLPHRQNPTQATYAPEKVGVRHE